MSKIVKSLNSDKGYRVVFLGDSTTSNEWVHPNWREVLEYVIKDQVEKEVEEWQKVYWDLRFFNYGLNGAGTADFLEYLQDEVLALKPNLVIFMGGDNDIVLDVPPAAHAENILQIRQLLSQAVDSFVFSPQIKSLDLELNSKYEQYLVALQSEPFGNEIEINMYAEFAKLNLKDLYTFRLDKDEAEAWGKKTGNIDPIHPNMLGQCLIAQIMLRELLGISFDPHTYLTELFHGIKYPKY